MNSSLPDSGASPDSPDLNPDLSDKEIAQLETLLRRLRPEAVEPELNLRIEHALLDARQQEREQERKHNSSVVRARFTTWVPLGAAAALAFTVVGIGMKPDPQQDSAQVAQTRENPQTVSSATALASVAAVETEVSGQEQSALIADIGAVAPVADVAAEPALSSAQEAAFDRVVVDHVVANHVRQSQLGRQIGLVNQGLVHDEQGLAHQIIHYRLDKRLDTSDSNPTEAPRRDHLNRERTILVPLEYY